MSINKIILDENEEPLQDCKGNIVCQVILESGRQEIKSFDRNTLIEAGLVFISDEAENVDNRGDNVQKSNIVEVINEESDENNLTQIWCEQSTRMLLDKYEQYLPLVGPMKRFKNKKAMWCQIATDLTAETKINRNFGQCENRYKTIMKRKRNAAKNNTISGAKRVKVDFEEEISRIAAIDDSLEPEILLSANKLIKKTKDKQDPKSNNHGGMKTCNNKKSLANIALQIHREKEDSRQRRHEEKMEFLKHFAKNFTKDKPESELE